MTPEIERMKARAAKYSEGTSESVYLMCQSAPQDIRALLDGFGVLWAALEKMGCETPVECQDKLIWTCNRCAALSDARKILGSEQEGGAGNGM